MAPAQRRPVVTSLNVAKGRILKEYWPNTLGMAFAFFAPVGRVWCRFALFFWTISSSFYAVDCQKVLLEKIGPATNTRARFISAEWPYHLPRNIKIFDSNSGFSIKDLKVGKRYLWVIDAQGAIRMAEEFSPFHNRPASNNHEGRNKIQHRDLLAKTTNAPEIFDPGNYEPQLEEARIGGEFRIQVDSEGKRQIEFHTRSAYTPAQGKVLPIVREDQLDRTSQGVLEAARDYFIELSRKNEPLSPNEFHLIPFEKAI